MSDPVVRAKRVVTWLGRIKWVCVILWLAYAVGAVWTIVEWTTWPYVTVVAPVVLAAVAALLTWAFLGAKQSSLEMLTILAAPLPPIEHTFIPASAPAVTGETLRVPQTWQT